MTGPSPGDHENGDASSSLAQSCRPDHDYDIEEPEDSGNESALLADDPLEDERQSQSAFPY